MFKERKHSLGNADRLIGIQVRSIARQKMLAQSFFWITNEFLYLQLGVRQQNIRRSCLMK